MSMGRNSRTINGAAVEISVSAAIQPVSSTGTFSATGQSTGAHVFGRFNVSLWGTFVGTVQLERTFDSGTTWLPITDEFGSAITWTAPASFVADEPEAGVMYRLNCTAYTSGTINYRVSQ